MFPGARGICPAGQLRAQCVHGLLENFLADLWVVGIKVEYLVANVDGFDIPLGLEIIKGELEADGCRGLVLKEPSLY